MRDHKTAAGIRVFLVIWSGQFASLIGSGLTNFALGIWVYQTSASITQFGLISALTLLKVAIAPLAGAMVDRYDRRTILIISDIVAGLSTLLIAVLFLTQSLHYWVIYLVVAIRSICDGFRLPAFNASTTLLVPKQQLGRANGLLQVAQAMAQILPPAIAGFMMGAIQLGGIILIDVATFVVAIVTLLGVPIPRITDAQPVQNPRRSLWSDIGYGWRYILNTPTLLQLLILFASLNFILGVVSVLITPLLLAITTAEVLGIVLGIGGTGMLAGGIVLSVWGGPKRRMSGIFGVMVLDAMCIAIAGVRPIVPLIAAATFGFFFGLAVIAGCMRTVFQSRVAPDVQGRVFSTIQMALLASVPLGSLVAGPLATTIFEPLMSPRGPLANTVGPVIGVGPGRGIGLCFIVMGVLMLIGTMKGYFHPRLRFVEDELADAQPKQIFA
jgi:MFS transporter, DHA3 family, macrolide efflux protein